MSFQNMFVRIIRETFLKEVGTFQSKSNDPLAFLLSLSLQIDYDTEEGYRYLDIAIFGPYNYVQVWTRERGVVIPIEGLEYTEDGDSFVKPGFKYKTAISPWNKISDHDSCWTSGIEHQFREYGPKILGLSGPEWYEIVSHSELGIPK